MILQTPPHDWIYSTERLIHQQDARIRGQSSSHRHPLLLSSRKLIRETRHELRSEPDALCGFDRLLAGFTLFHPIEPQHSCDIVRHRPMRQQARMLQNISDRASELSGVFFPNIPAIDSHRAAVRGDELVYALQQRRFTAAGGTEQDRDLAARRFKGEPLHSRGILSRILHGDVAKSNHTTRAYRPAGPHEANWRRLAEETSGAELGR